ncbi:MAG TPA: serine/threonine-protein kinase [Verrucomicrobiae bacterium]|nr:serine/threonine-protein kinase [Verrucomicrobiae bacterium]
MKAIIEWHLFRPVMGAALTVLCGLILWGTPIGDPWVNASYDYQFRFGTRAVTNQVVLVQMDNQAYKDLHQERYDPLKPGSHPWDRELHARLLKRLAEGGASLVVMDVFFIHTNDAVVDKDLADALRQQKNVVIGGTVVREVNPMANPKVDAMEPTYPADIFLDAARGHWGIAWLDADSDFIVRKQWPFPSPSPSSPPQFFSLPWEAALLQGAKLDNNEPRERWLRYYHEGVWARISYRDALEKSPAWFREKIVFIGGQPQFTAPDKMEDDKFRTPFTRWTSESSGGVDINITAFLNLINGEWLERPPFWAEGVVVALAGILLGGGLCKLRPLPAWWTAVAVAVVVTLGSVSWSYFGNHWFPWLVIAAGQVPVAFVWAVFMPAFHRVEETLTIATVVKQLRSGQTVQTGPKPPTKTPADELPDTPDYELFDPPFGEGAYGKVWVVRNAVNQLQALKVIYLSKFDNNTDPFDREFNGISRYKPISDKHPGLLRVDFVTRKREGYFYYVMELGDSMVPGWERDPAKYKPRDLARVRSEAPNRRLPVSECIRIGVALSDALEFLHQQGLTHRDIKPQNIIFVKGQPKLADVGLTAEIRPADAERTFVGTPGYMPPPPERPGTAQADIYALGMVLYVTSTGRAPTLFPEIATTLIQDPATVDFLPFNNVILKACDPDCARRYQSAAEMREALKELEKDLAKG